MIKERILKNVQDSSRFVDIFKNKLSENNNRRGNIILNSLSQKKQGSSQPMADPKVYSLIGKLHHCSDLPPPASPKMAITVHDAEHDINSDSSMKNEQN